MPKGKVILAGAGPGDPELLTIKALRWLQKADVVIVDRLVSREALQEFTRADVLIVPVGKKCNDQASTPQSVINDLLVEYANQGKLVVRLKGGDVSIFSNVLDELQTLVSNDIEFELVPGVTAALGAAAYAGIPLTARGFSTAVRMLTYYKLDLLNESYVRDLATTEDTLVFYMSSGSVDQLVEKLLSCGIEDDRSIAIIEQATTPNQHVTSHPIREYLSNAAGNVYASPTLIIIGKVASLHASFGWVPNSDTKEQYFTPLSVASNNLFNQKLPIC
jgi:uroporphyrin-III C-methyltransferase/precorrin-2 dehydrogenase/sirohydrochlorin ferrochelatase/uroporphyrin-III C-methyltransferase